MTSNLILNAVSQSRPRAKIFTSDEILQRSDYVLLDTCVSTSDGDWYSGTFLGLNKKSEFSLGSIEKEIESARRFADFLENPNVLVTPGVSQEILSFVDRLKKNIDLVKIKAGFRRGWLKREDLEKLSEFYELQETRYYKCKESEFFPREKTEYDFLEKIVLGVTEETHAKIDYGKVYHPDRRTEKRVDFHTDEQLVASALYLSVAEDKSCAIITRDTDIKRILFNTLSYLTYPYTFAYAGIVESTNINKMIIYFPTDNAGFCQRYNSVEFSSHNRNVISKEKLASIRQKLNSYVSPLVA